jgi:D-aminopeptidase
LTHACASSAEALNFGSDFKDVKNETRNAAHAADVAKAAAKNESEMKLSLKLRAQTVAVALWASRRPGVERKSGMRFPTGSGYSQPRCVSQFSLLILIAVVREIRPTR